MIAHQIEDGIVVNTIVVDSLDVIPDLIAGDTGKIGDAWDGEVFTSPVLPEVPLTQADYTAALEAMYDAKARERQYDNRLTCALRAGYAGPFQAEGTAFAIWMDTANATAYGVMADVMAGEIPMPTIAELLAMMPEMVWP